VRFLLVNAVIAVAVCLGVVAVINNGIVTAADLPGNTPAVTPGAATTPPTPVPNPADDYQRVVLRGVPASAQFLRVSFDDSYYTYLDGGVVRIFKVSTGTQVHQITAAHPITYSLLLDDADLLVYFSQHGTSIDTKTYNIATGKSLAYRPLTVPAGSTIVKVNYAVNTNLVYVITRSPQGTDTVSRIDIMNVVTARTLSVAVANFIPSATSLNLYYQSTRFQLFYNYAPAKVMAGKRVELIGRGAGDEFYLLSRSTPNQVDVVSRTKGKVVRTFSIPAGATSFYSDQSTIYAVYADRLVDLTAQPFTSVEFQTPGRFVAVVAKTLYFLPAA